MPKFNLGKIKGDTGARGEQGVQGEQGIQGEQGPKGDRGEDGYTPVFTVGTVETVEAGSNALVEIDSSDPRNPVISFSVPKGADGRDNSGDMETSVYDVSGKKTDVYNYAEQLVNHCIKESGGALSGKLFSAGGETSAMCVRNLCIADELPGDARIGDFCLLKEKKSQLTIDSLAVGSSVGVYENGQTVPYVIAGKDYHIDGTVTLVRKCIYTNMKYAAGDMYKYETSFPDMYLEHNYRKLLSDAMQKKLRSVKLSDGQYRSVFIPSREEIREMEYFKTNSAVAKNDSGDKCSYWTRSRHSSTSRVYIISTGGDAVAQALNYTDGLRPMVVVDKNFCIQSADNSEFLYEMSESKTGLFVREESGWEKVMNV